ncbi:MAG: polysaccharide deacetylase family protein [Salibacteraceae bacterium]
MEILVYSAQKTSRLSYTLNLIINDVLGHNYMITNDLDTFKNSKSVKFSYAFQSDSEQLNVIPNGLLFKTGVDDLNIVVSGDEKTPEFFRNGDALLGFDFLSASFYLASRYEEYLPHLKDKHGRFAAAESMAFKNDFLDLPLINIWAGKFFNHLKSISDVTIEDKRKYSFLPSIDVDNAYAYKEKGLVRTMGAFGRSLLSANINDLKVRTRTILNLEHDPYDTFDQFIALEKKYGLNQLFFFLVGDYGMNDKNVPIYSRKFQSLIKHVNDYCQVGLHPSFASNSEPERLNLEKERLTSVVHESISKSRQHFLILDLPNTYRELIDNDLMHDYSMGYPDLPGFRASICSPYKFYDLELEKETQLTIHPFSFMEATFKYYQPKEFEEIIDLVSKQIETIRNVKGQFCVLWHSDSLSETEEWKGWNSLYEKVVKLALP